jgi:hypothetical protein
MFLFYINPHLQKLLPKLQKTATPKEASKSNVIFGKISKYAVGGVIILMHYKIQLFPGYVKFREGIAFTNGFQNLNTYIFTS